MSLYHGPHIEVSNKSVHSNLRLDKIKHDMLRVTWQSASMADNSLHPPVFQKFISS